jgi:hypothetical protein
MRLESGTVGFQIAHSARGLRGPIPSLTIFVRIGDRPPDRAFDAIVRDGKNRKDRKSAKIANFGKIGVSARDGAVVIWGSGGKGFHAKHAKESLKENSGGGVGAAIELGISRFARKPLALAFLSVNCYFFRIKILQNKGVQ